MDVKAPGIGSGNLYKSRGGRRQGSHNKPIGCGASGAYASGPNDKDEESLVWFYYTSFLGLII
jgi:hypothetical protein